MKNDSPLENRRPYEVPQIRTVSGKQLLEDLGPALANIYDPPNGF